MIDYDKVFEALPNVSTIWVTQDGNFHLHPHNGGEQIDRDKLEPIKPIEPKLVNDEPNQLESVEQPEPIDAEPIDEPDEVEQPEPIDAEPIQPEPIDAETIQPEPLNEPRQKRAYNKRK